MAKQSAGILLYKKAGSDYEVLLVHPGGPFWAKKDAGVWSIPKGEYEVGEDILIAAKREFEEELGSPIPDGELIDLGSAKQSSGKVVYAWALEADFDAANTQSNTISIEWPPKSGQQQEIPEVDRAEWVPTGIAKAKLVRGQVPLLEALVKRLGIALDDTVGQQQANEQTSLF